MVASLVEFFPVRMSLLLPNRALGIMFTICLLLFCIVYGNIYVGSRPLI